MAVTFTTTLLAINDIGFFLPLNGFFTTLEDVAIGIFLLLIPLSTLSPVSISSRKQVEELLMSRLKNGLVRVPMKISTNYR